VALGVVEGRALPSGRVGLAQTLGACARAQRGDRLERQLFVEVDGYAYHWSPEQKRYDDARRNRLRLLGVNVLVYDWQAVVKGPTMLVAEVRQVLAKPTR
jgi:hypothetical protein